MPLELQEINAEKDFPALTRRMVEAYEEPMQSFVQVYLSPLYQDKSKRDECIEEMAERLAMWHAHDPSSYWQKVVDTETGEIAGGALWNIHEENPFAHQHELEATWFPDDGSRKFAEAWLEQYGTPRALKGQRPQVYLFIVFTSPKYRRRGVAQQFVSWGKKKADEMGVEMFLDATPMGRPMYEANGFTLAMENIIDLKTETADEAWKEAERRVGPVSFYLMWRPAGGSPWESAREKDLAAAAAVNANVNVNRQQLAEASAHF